MNKIIESINKSASIDLIAESKRLKEAGVDIIGLAGGEPDFNTPNKITKKAIDELLNGNTHYAVGCGLLELRKRIARKLVEENKLTVKAENIVVTPGAKMAVYLAIRSCINPGDEVLIPTPSWVSYAEIVKASYGIPISVPLDPNDGYKLTEKRLKMYASEKTKMLIVCSPNNPTGRLLNENEIKELEKFIGNKNIILLSDEIYEKISFKDNVLSPGSSKLLSKKTITINGFSKAYAMTGWRLGYLAAPINIIPTILKLYTHTITCTPPFLQEAASIAFDCKKEVEKMRLEYKRKRDYFVTELNRINGIDVLVPDGGFYAWCKFNVSGNIAQKLLNEARVVGVPGEAYGEGYNSFIRFSFAYNMADLIEAVKRIKAFMVSNTK